MPICGSRSHAITCHSLAVNLFTTFMLSKTISSSGNSSPPLPGSTISQHDKKQGRVSTAIILPDQTIVRVEAFPAAGCHGYGHGMETESKWRPKRFLAQERPAGRGTAPLYRAVLKPPSQDPHHFLAECLVLRQPPCRSSTYAIRPSVERVFSMRSSITRKTVASDFAVCRRWPMC
jgi:hypothetical protein